MTVSISTQSSKPNLAKAAVPLSAAVGLALGYAVASQLVAVPLLAFVGLLLIGMAFGVIVAAWVKAGVEDSADFSTLMLGQTIGLIGFISILSGVLF